MFRTENQEMILAPTHEEEITSLVGSLANSYRQLPLRLYQIGEKFRNEARPRGGLLRCREFVMKDLYTFDRSREEAQDTYNQVCEAYNILFGQLGLTFYKAQAGSGAIGGSCSHEYHLECESGQDTILSCSACSFVGNVEVIVNKETSTCPECASKSSLTTKKGLEIGHTFLLGNKYSNILDAKFKDQAGKEHDMEMGCYGIGVTRLLAAIVEASHDEKGIIWPPFIAPFQSYIIPLKSDSVASQNFNFESQKDALFDDRPGLTFSHKFKDALLTGIPNIYVFGGNKKSAANSDSDGVEWYKRVKGGADLQ